MVLECLSLGTPVVAVRCLEVLDEIIEEREFTGEPLAF